MSKHQTFARRYQEVAVRTANPLELVVMLYDGAINALQEAQEYLKIGAIAERVRCINRSMEIISELQSALDFKVGGEIAGSLNRLYVYMRQRIFRANLEQKAEPLMEVVGLLENLRSAWKELASEAQKKEAACTAAASPSFSAKTSPVQEVGSLDIAG